MVTRRQFSREFKIEAVKLVTERGVAASQVARDLDVHERKSKGPGSHYFSAAHITTPTLLARHRAKRTHPGALAAGLWAWLPCAGR